MAENITPPILPPDELGINKVPTSSVVNTNYKKKHKLIADKAEQLKLDTLPVSIFMNSSFIKLGIGNTIKGTIETFRIHHISGAPVVDFQGRVLGVITEYDLLIQAASKKLTSAIEYQTTVISVTPETPLKEVLVILYMRKLKWMPVVTKDNFIQGVVSRIDVLNFIATHTSND